MNTRTSFRISLAAGIAIVAIAALGRLLPPVPVCGALAPGYDPIVAFEMARSASDLHAIFGDAPGECRTAIAERMDTINIVDCAIYIPIYGSFLVFLLLGLRSQHPKLANRGAVVVVIACVADYVENMSLFRLSAEPETATSALSLLVWSTEVKWVGLGVAGAIAGLLLANRGGAWRLALVPCSLGLLASLASIFVPNVVGPYLSLSFLFGWLLFLAVDAREAFRSSKK